MYARVDKTKENKSKAVANSVVQNKWSGNQSTWVVDNRSETIVQRKLEEVSILQRYPDSNEEEQIPTDATEVAYDLAHAHPASDPEPFQTVADTVNHRFSYEWVMDYSDVVGDEATVYYAIHAHFNNGNSNPPTHLHFKECGIGNMEILFDLPLAMYAVLPTGDQSDSDDESMF